MDWILRGTEIESGGYNPALLTVGRRILCPRTHLSKLYMSQGRLLVGTSASC